MRINNLKNNQNFKGLSPFSGALGQFYNANATLPTLVIETGVTLGRANEANKRGGKPEAIDRLVEQGISAIVWIYGVKALKGIGDFIGEKILKYDLNFDIGFDKLRNPLKNVEKNVLKFKAGNILVSTALATYFIGAILPKINNAILAKTLKKEKYKKNTYKPKMYSFEEFKNKTSKNKQISFKALGGIENLAHILENNSTARLLITDTGVIAGRFHNAPNKYRKIEGLFRDIASIYFYLKATQDITGVLNKITKNTDINPNVLEHTVEMLSKKLKENPDLSCDDFLKLAVGKAKDRDLEKLKILFGNEKVIDLETFKKEFKEAFEALEENADKMSALQYPIKGKKVLSFRQAQDVLVNSWTCEASFLKKAFEKATGRKNIDIADSKTFVSSKFLDKTRASIDKFIEQIYKSAKEKGDDFKINKDFIESIAKKNISKNFAFNIIGTIISIFALGTLIPKVQYAITRKMTNENKFHTEKE